MVQDIILMLLAIAISTFGTIVGFGGGVFMVPLLILCFNYSIEIAIGSMMAAMLPASFISSFFSYREKNIDYLVASLIQFPAMAGTVAGAFLVAFLPVIELQFIFAFFIIIIGFLILSEPQKQKNSKQKSGYMHHINHLPTSFIRKNHEKHLAYRLNGSIIAFFGFITGTVAGLFGSGGGFLQTPVMIKVFGIPAKIATSTSLFILMVTSLTGLSTHFWLGHVKWDKSIPLIIAFSAGAIVGNYFKKEDQRMPDLDILIGPGLFLAGMALIINTIVKSDALFNY